MKKIFDSAKIIQFKELIDLSTRIAIVSHTNPDGDAIGSGLALKSFLSRPGKEVRFFVPNRFPRFLDFIPGSDTVQVFCDLDQATRAFVSDADLIICVDFNQITRLDKMTPYIEDNVIAPKILIDHHLDPPGYELAFTDPRFSSTCQIVYELITRVAGTEAIDKDMAVALYTGMVTDTGNLSFGPLNPELYRAVGELVGKGVVPADVSRAVFNTQSENRLRMVGYLISEKMVVRDELATAYITLTREEKTRFKHQIGDTEGIVNMPLTIERVTFAVMFIETLDCIKISFRSKGDFDVNTFAQQHFGGGGHRNASGGKFFGTMADAVARFEEILKTHNPLN